MSSSLRFDGSTRLRVAPPDLHLRNWPARDAGWKSILIVVGVVLIVGALTFVPALALGPIAEHLTWLGGAR